LEQEEKDKAATAEEAARKEQAEKQSAAARQEAAEKAAQAVKEEAARKVQVTVVPVEGAIGTIDTAMISVLKDLSKAARESEDIQRIEDPAQKAAANAALLVLDSALEKAQGGPNRIVASGQKDSLGTTLTAEAWDAGPLQLPGKAQASLNAIWAKKLNG